MTKKTINEIKNEIMSYLISDNDLIKAITINKEDFLNRNLSKDILEDPSILIRKQIFPYKQNITTVTDAKTLITTSYENFKKQGSSYRGGDITFYILVPEELEKTNYGSRYDWIADKIEEIFNKRNIGDLDYKERGDMEINTRYLGHYLVFHVIDFYLK